MKTFININIIIKIIKMNKVLPNEYDCSICLSGLDDYCITPCNHLFHEESGDFFIAGIAIHCQKK